MKGLHIEKLEVKLDDQSTAIWYRNADQGPQWNCATINVIIDHPESRVCSDYSLFIIVQF